MAKVTDMKHIFIGANGSIGKRHIANLHHLRPEAEIVTVDIAGQADYRNILDADLKDNAVYICSPTVNHIYHFDVALAREARAIFVEKPLWGLRESIGFHDTSDVPPDVPVAVGYNLRFHPLFIQLKQQTDDILCLNLYGSENLSKKYGNTALETMACHGIDMALWLLGPAEFHVVSNHGDSATVKIVHLNGTVSVLHANMSSPFRIMVAVVVWKTSGARLTQFVEADDKMYKSEMEAWLKYIEIGKRDPRLCSYEEAVRVQEIMHGS